MAEETKDATNKLDIIHNIQKTLYAADFDLNAFMELVVNEMMQLTPADAVVIELASNKDMVYRAGTGELANYKGLRLPIKGSISGLCVESKEVLLSNDTETDSRVNLEACRKVGARSLVVAPLFNNEDAVGVLKILSNKPNIFTPEHVKILQIVAGFLGTALANQIYTEIRNSI